MDVSFGRNNTSNVEIMKLCQGREWRNVRFELCSAHNLCQQEARENMDIKIYGLSGKGMGSSTYTIVKQ
jgi:hypothetical protein